MSLSTCFVPRLNLRFTRLRCAQHLPAKRKGGFKLTTWLARRCRSEGRVASLSLFRSTVLTAAVKRHRPVTSPLSPTSAVLNHTGEYYRNVYFGRRGLFVSRSVICIRSHQWPRFRPAALEMHSQNFLFAEKFLRRTTQAQILPRSIPVPRGRQFTYIRLHLDPTRGDSHAIYPHLWASAGMPSCQEDLFHTASLPSLFPPSLRFPVPCCLDYPCSCRNDVHITFHLASR